MAALSCVRRHAGARGVRVLDCIRILPQSHILRVGAAGSEGFSSAPPLRHDRGHFKASLACYLVV